jgi:hypothetical protein
MVDPGGGGAACCTVTEAFPVMEGSSVLVAVTVTVWADAGAVSEPLAEMAPALAVQVTAELKLPEPCTVAVHCVVPSALTADGEQVALTEETSDVEPDVEPESGLEPPHPRRNRASADADDAARRRCRRWLRRASM